LIEASLTLLARKSRKRAWAAAGAGYLLCHLAQGLSFGHAEEAAATSPSPQIWTCHYVATTPDGPLRITAKFQVIGEELAEIETIPPGLNFNERYKILENNDTDIVAGISIAKVGEIPLPSVGAVVIIIAKQNGLFQQSGVLLGVWVGPPTVGHCEGG
jgi:hypothetical protein